MSLVKDSQEVIEISEMEGRLVTVYLEDYDPETGILHAITEHGILIKIIEGEYEGSYFIFPWRLIKWIEHVPENIRRQKEENIRRQKEERELVGQSEESIKDPIMEDVDNVRLRLLIIRDKAESILSETEDYTYDLTIEGSIINIEVDEENVGDISGDTLTIQDSDCLNDLKLVANKLNLKLDRAYEDE